MISYGKVWLQLVWIRTSVHHLTLGSGSVHDPFSHGSIDTDPVLIDNFLLPEKSFLWHQAILLMSKLTNLMFSVFSLVAILERVTPKHSTLLPSIFMFFSSACYTYILFICFRLRVKKCLANFSLFHSMFPIQ